MKRRNRLRSPRPQATFGADGAIMAAAQIASAVMQSNATTNAARQQAEAMREGAKQQTDALIKQNENNTKLQQDSIAFTKGENERNRALQKEVQMQLQMLTGQQNTNELREAAKIQVKCGGSMRKKLRNAGDYQSPSYLRGMDGNLPFTVTDGGSVIPVAITPEGYDLYEIIGNDHNHYHKAQGGKNKTGVGIKFAGSQTIEGEGNQNSNQGELMLVTPNDAKFISRHSIRGFNPAKAVMSGIHPLEAFAQQEALKEIYGISDDGKDNSSTPVRGIKPYGGNTIIPITPDLSLDFMSPVATGIVAGTRNENQARNGRCLRRCGGRRKAKWGTTQRGNIYGSLWNTAGNLGGAFITTLGNNSAAKILTSGYNDAANTLIDAYGNLKTIDMSAIDRNNFRAAHAMAALQAPIVNDGAQRAAAQRSRDRMIRRINNNTLSSAAALNRIGRVESDYNDKISQIAEGSDKIRQGIIQENMRRLTDVSQKNAELDTQANQTYSQAYLNLLQYNNDIANERITGAAQAKADALTRNAEAWSGTKQANANSWAGAFATSANSIGSSIATNAKMNHELQMSKYGWTQNNLYDWYATHPNDEGFDAFMNKYKGIGGDYKNWYNNLYAIKYGRYPKQSLIPQLPYRTLR